MLPAPVIAVILITLGVPLLVLVALVSLTSGIDSSVLTSILTMAVLSTFLVLMIFEIRRLVELPPDEH
jgi:hypothetical protein